MKRPNKKNISFLAIALLFFFPLMKFHIQSKAIILSAIAILIVSNKERLKKTIKSVDNHIFLVNVLWFVWLAITLIYSEDVSRGLNAIQKGLPFLVIPSIVFYFIPCLKENQRQRIFQCFIIANFILATSLFLYLHQKFFSTYQRIYVTDENEFDIAHYIPYLINNQTYLYHQTDPEGFPLFFHKSYFSIGIVFCIFLMVRDFFFKSKTWFRRTLESVLLLFFITNLLIYQSWTHVVFCVFAFPAYMVFLKLEKLSKTKWFPYFMVFYISLGIVFFISSYETRYKLYEAYSIRAKINQCSFELFENRPIFGYGIGSVEKELTDCYERKLEKDETYLYPFQEKQNTHNNFVFIYLTGGVIALILLFMMLGKGFFISIRNNDPIYFIFLTLVVFTMLFENVFSRIYGILFFVLFNSVLLQQYIYKHPKKVMA